MSDLSEKAGSSQQTIIVNKITREDPWRWLAKGWSDIWSMPFISLSYGAIFTAISVGLFLGLIQLDLMSMSLTLSAGFMLVGPMLAVGLYEASRRRELGEDVKLKDILLVGTKSTAQLTYMGLLLMILYLIWVRMATLLYAIMFGMSDFPPMNEFLATLFGTPEGAIMLTVGTVGGAIIAVLVFAISAISVPLLMRRDTDFMTAALTSIQAIQMNLWPMALWAWLIALFTMFGIMLMGFGMIIIFPLIGHATWHAYRSLVPPLE